jgi:hypothetical protein
LCFDNLCTTYCYPCADRPSVRTLEIQRRPQCLVLCLTGPTRTCSCSACAEQIRYKQWWRFSLFLQTEGPQGFETNPHLATKLAAAQTHYLLVLGSQPLSRSVAQLEVLKGLSQALEPHAGRRAALGCPSTTACLGIEQVVLDTPLNLLCAYGWAACVCAKHTRLPHDDAVQPLLTRLQPAA